MNEAHTEESDQKRASPGTGRKIHIVFDMTSALLLRTGGRVYAEELANILRAQDQYRVTCICDKLPARRGGIWNLVNELRHLVWIQIILPIKLIFLRADVLHASSFFAPMLCPCPVVLMIFDAFYMQGKVRRRNWLAPLYSRLLIGASVRRADVICTLSRSSRSDIESALKIAPGRIRVTYPGVNPRYRPQSEADVAAIREKYSLARPFFLYVGTWAPRKNVLRLIDAFRIFRNEAPTDHELILIGQRPLFERPEVRERLQDPRIAAHVRSLGFVPDEEMPGMYAACQALIFPSLGEGFGLPVIEAMACGTPVLSSNASSLPEVAGDAALFFDPQDPADIARAMRCSLQPELQKELKIMGLERARLFTWERTARETETAYHEALDRSLGCPKASQG